MEITFILGGLGFAGLMWLILKGLSSSEQKRMSKEGITSYYIVHYIGGHPYITPDSFATINFMNDGNLRLDASLRNDIIQISDIISCEIETGEQVKNNASLAKTMIFGVSSLKDTVAGVQYMFLTYKLEGQEITCMFRAEDKRVNPSTSQYDLNIAKIAFEIKKLMNS